MIKYVVASSVLVLQLMISSDQINPVARTYTFCVITSNPTVEVLNGTVVMEMVVLRNSINTLYIFTP
jgi:hypothetical protein